MEQHLKGLAPLLTVKVKISGDLDPLLSEEERLQHFLSQLSKLLARFEATPPLQHQLLTDGSWWKFSVFASLPPLTGPARGGPAAKQKQLIRWSVVSLPAQLLDSLEEPGEGELLRPLKLLASLCYGIVDPLWIWLLYEPGPEQEPTPAWVWWIGMQAAEPRTGRESSRELRLIMEGPLWAVSGNVSQSVVQFLVREQQERYPLFLLMLSAWLRLLLAPEPKSSHLNLNVEEGEEHC